MAEDGEALHDLGPSIWRRWTRALSEKDDAFRTLVLASAGLEGGGYARMVVLRAVEAQERRLEFHTDVRSPKVEQLQADPHATLLVWHAAERLQVRAEGRVVLFAEGTDLARERFEALSESARTTYGTQPASGLSLDNPGALDASPSGDFARRSFVVAQLTVERIDWLRLTPQGQRRAEIVYRPTGAIQRWIAP